MKTYTTDEILTKFRMAKYPLNDDGTRRVEYYNLMKQKWISVDELLKELKLK